jgi:putative effector of murein hydrolase LrgA (UPF0299 family)
MPTGRAVERPIRTFVAALCGAVAVLATALPWVQTQTQMTYLNATVTALQNAPILLVPPAVALLAYWRLRSDPPASMTGAAIYSQRLAFGVGIVLCVLLVGEMNNTNQVLGYFGLSNAVNISLEIGFYAYSAASAVGLIASLLTTVYRPNARGLP